jgi:hypothetical protein
MHDEDVAGEFFGACAPPRGDAVGPARLDRQEPAAELDDAAVENRRFGRGDLDLQPERMGGEQLGDPKPAISNAAVTLSPKRLNAPRGGRSPSATILRSSLDRCPRTGAG